MWAAVLRDVWSCMHSVRRRRGKKGQPSSGRQWCGMDGLSTVAKEKPRHSVPPSSHHSSLTNRMIVSHMRTTQSITNVVLRDRIRTEAIALINIGFLTPLSLSFLFTRVKADIITRRYPTRSKGFGFVLYETLAHAELAAQTYDKTELGGRTIIVEVATPRGERPRRERPPRPPKEQKENKDDASAEADADTDAAEVKPRTGRGNRSSSSRKRNKRVRWVYHCCCCCLFTLFST